MMVCASQHPFRVSVFVGGLEGVECATAGAADSILRAVVVCAILARCNVRPLSAGALHCGSPLREEPPCPLPRPSQPERDRPPSAARALCQVYCASALNVAHGAERGGVVMLQRGPRRESRATVWTPSQVYASLHPCLILVLMEMWETQ